MLLTIHFDIVGISIFRYRISKNITPIQHPRYALYPSACFHVYEGYRGKTLSDNCTVTLCQSVFRMDKNIKKRICKLFVFI